MESLEGKDTSITEVALSVCISGMVNEDDIREVVGDDMRISAISVNRTDRTWLKYLEYFFLLTLKASKVCGRYSLI